MGGADITLYAQWSINPPYNVKFDANLGAGAPMSDQAIIQGSSASLFSNTYTRPGYSFSGWNTAANGSGTPYANGATFTMGGADVWLYAQWTSLSADANLSALVVNSLPISPSFLSATLLYTASASSSFPTVSVTPTSVEPGATIRARINAGGYSPVSSGLPSGTLMLDSPVGVNVIEVEVTAPDLATVKTYTVTVNKTVAVTITAGANGTVTPLGMQERTPGATVPLVATPAVGYRFSNWTGTASVVPVNMASATLTVSNVDTMTTANFVPDFAGGDGTGGMPYQISNLAQLKNMNNFRSSFFSLIAPIDLSSESNWIPIGDLGSKFSGGFDGGNFTLSNLTINSAGGDRGFFGYTNGALIKYVKLTNINITTTSGSFVGGLIGSAGGTTSVTDCTVSGVINAYQGVGGLVGNADTGDVLTVLRCSADVDITIPYAGVGTFGGLIGSTKGGSVTKSFATGDIGPHGVGTPSTVGGLIGMNWDTVVTDCYATGNVYGVNNVGGLIGSMTYNVGPSSVTRSYSVGAVAGTGTSPGGLVGSKGVSCTVTDSFYDTTISGQTDNVGKGVPKTTVEMKTAATFSTLWAAVWGTIWSIVASYPFLL